MRSDPALHHAQALLCPRVGGGAGGELHQRLDGRQRVLELMDKLGADPLQLPRARQRLLGQLLAGPDGLAHRGAGRVPEDGHELDLHEEGLGAGERATAANHGPAGTGPAQRAGSSARPTMARDRSAIPIALLRDQPCMENTVEAVTRMVNASGPWRPPVTPAARKVWAMVTQMRAVAELRASCPARRTAMAMAITAGPSAATTARRQAG